MAAIVSGAFIEAILGIFLADVLQGFMAIATFLAMTVFSFPDSMDTQGGGVGVIPIRIGVTRITPGILTILTIHIIPISFSRRRTPSSLSPALPPIAGISRSWKQNTTKSRQQPCYSWRFDLLRPTCEPDI